MLSALEYVVAIGFRWRLHCAYCHKAWRQNYHIQSIWWRYPDHHTRSVKRVSFHKDMSNISSWFKSTKSGNIELHCENDNCEDSFMIALLSLCWRLCVYICCTYLFLVFGTRGRLHLDYCERREKPTSLQNSGWTCGAHQARLYFSKTLPLKTANFPIVADVMFSELSSIYSPDNLCFLQTAVDCIEVIFIRGTSLMYFKVFLVDRIPTETIIVTIGEWFMTD